MLTHTQKRACAHTRIYVCIMCLRIFRKKWKNRKKRSNRSLYFHLLYFSNKQRKGILFVDPTSFAINPDFDLAPISSSFCSKRKNMLQTILFRAAVRHQEMLWSSQRKSRTIIFPSGWILLSDCLSVLSSIPANIIFSVIFSFSVRDHSRKLFIKRLYISSFLPLLTNHLLTLA